MKAIILCAGYATRLYPLTLNQPKPLLPVGGKPILEYTLERLKKIETLAIIENIYMITNLKFRDQFHKWLKESGYSKKIKILNDQSTTNENRLGAIRDLDLVLKEKKIEDDILVIAGDNLFDFDLKDFIKEAISRKPQVTIGIYELNSREEAKKFGVVQIAEDKSILHFVEKSEEPPTTLASTGIYFFPKENLILFDEYLAERENPDAPGYFIHWLVGRTKVYAHIFYGLWYDIGSIDSYYQADRKFKQRLKK